MRIEMLQVICCPSCHQRLILAGSHTEDGTIWHGMLNCQHCLTSYEIDKGMPHLYVDDETWAPKAREAVGWVEHLKQLGIYEQHDNVVDQQAPYYPQEPWIRVAKSFDMGLAHLNLTGNERILDLGAGRGWAAKQFALLGCEVVALDIIADENVGLGRAKFLMNQANTYFDRVIGDGENLPFFPATFDIVFCCGSLHHSSNLALLTDNIAKVLKPNGRLCAINEPCICILDDEQAILSEYASEELELGINENRPDFIDYTQAVIGSGLDVEQAIPAQTNGMSLANLRVWGREVGALWGGVPLRSLREFTRKSIRFIGRDAYATITRRWPFLKIRLDSVRQDERRMRNAILLYCHTELFLIARKDR
jgi:SAM-dependent methyltransferase/uncharacterized protein YbaR (Trm112 family)